MTTNASADLVGLDLHAECVRLRDLNRKLVNAVVLAAVGGMAALAFGVFAMTVRPERERIALDANGRAVPLVALTKNDPPDARITRMAADCINDLFNHAFHNYQTTVERAIGACFTGGGSESVRRVLDPFLVRVNKDAVNMASTFVIQPFINSRDVLGSGASARNVFHIQGVVAIGYRGAKAVKPVEYAFQTDVVRVSYDSHVEGIRLQNIILVPYEH